METMQKDVKTMREEIAGWRKELFTLKMNAVMGQVKDTSQFKKLRKNIARAMTQMSRAQGGLTLDNVK